MRKPSCCGQCRWLCIDESSLYADACDEIFYRSFICDIDRADCSKYLTDGYKKDCPIKWEDGE